MRPLARIVAPAALALAWAWASGCQLGGVPSDEIAGSPIAIRYRTPEEARRRAEALADQAEPRDARPETAARDNDASRREIVPHVDDMTTILGQVLGPRERNETEIDGRLALLDPRSGEIELVEAALRGAVPQAWSADRKRLLFSQAAGGGFQLSELNLEDGTVRRVTRGPMTYSQGCYGPEGRIVVTAFDMRETPPRAHVAISQPGGRSPYRPLTSGPFDHSPSCAPDGSAVAYVRQDRLARPSLMVRAPVLTGVPKRLSPGQQPAFASDSEWIVFSAPSGRGRSQVWRLWRVRADGSGRAPVGRGMRDESRPSFSPDGRLVVYVASEADHRSHLYVRRLDGSGDRILFASGDGEFPVW